MAAQYVRDFNADLGELSLNLEGDKNWKRFAADRINKIQKREATRNVLFFKKPTENLEIFINGETDPYIIQKGRIKDDFEWVQSVIKKFCEKYKVKYEE